MASFASVWGYVRQALVLMGVMAEVAADVAPAFGAGEKTQADLEKARTAGKAAQKLSDAAGQIHPEK